MGDVFGVICHHTGGRRTGIMPSLAVIRDGRPDLGGPLAQLGLGRDGTFFVVAAGKANHAGKGMWQGLVNGNTNFIGIEAENAGTADDLPWPAVQIDAYQRGVAAILRHIGRGAEFCAGHREYALPKGRKDDPSFDMNAFRAGVASILSGSAPAPILIPPVEPTATARPTLRRGAEGPFVELLQRILGIQPPGPFGPKTEVAVRDLQRKNGAVPDGIVGPKTWLLVDRVAQV
jgi:peptidoglycan hydrolase-like protein with peptidoglycan-binding domain